MLDLVMWTLNGQETLDRSLSSIDRSIPESKVCHRLIMDGGSIDSTSSIAERHGWKVVRSKRGIANQANEALSRVDTEHYASFEQDILLSPQWFNKITRFASQDDVAVAQGIRFVVGSPTMGAVDRENFARTIGRGPLASIDNTLCKTSIIRGVGGYRTSNNPQRGVDSLLLESIGKTRYRWVIDQTCVSGHLRPSLAYHLHHSLQGYQLRLWQLEPTIDHFRLFGTSPFRGAELAAKYHSPRILLGYPILRWAALVAGLSPRT
jgi:glycosyltransferase involved in cell wall biosynthesis